MLDVDDGRTTGWYVVGTNRNVSGECFILRLSGR